MTDIKIKIAHGKGVIGVGKIPNDLGTKLVCLRIVELTTKKEGKKP